MLLAAISPELPPSDSLFESWGLNTTSISRTVTDDHCY